MKRFFKKLGTVTLALVIFFIIGDICNLLVPILFGDALDYYKPREITDVYQAGNYLSDSFIEINGNDPIFSEDELVPICRQEFSKLDSLGRCGAAFAVVGKESMPTEDRGNINNIYPTAWHSVKYDMVAGYYLYNRCHLIGFQLTGENANELNLITGTSFLNSFGMKMFEDKIAYYAKEENIHIALRVTPIFHKNNLLASGVQMEAKSIEDDGKRVCFNVYCYNVQPGIIIDYRTGESAISENFEEINPSDNIHTLDTDKMIYHSTDFEDIKNIRDGYNWQINAEHDWMKELGYSPCNKCS